MGRFLREAIGGPMGQDPDGADADGGAGSYVSQGATPLPAAPASAASGSVASGTDVPSTANALIACPACCSGAFSPTVLAFQQAYNATGPASPLDPDGLYGPLTAHALAGYGAAPPPPTAVPTAGPPTAGPPTAGPFGSLGAAAPGQFLPSVLAAFVSFTTPLEGSENFMYQDDRGFVTTGIGNKIDPVEQALGLPWQVDGRLLSQDEIRAQWQIVKANTNPTLMSTGAANIPGNTARLTAAAVSDLVQSKVKTFATILLQYFPNVASWPADGQLGLLGVAWATGPSLPLVSYMAPFVAAVRADDFATMAATAHWSNITAKRKAQLELLFENAAAVAQRGLDTTLLNWPTRITAGMALTAAGTATAVGVGGYVIGGALFLGFLGLLKLLTK